MSLAVVSAASAGNCRLFLSAASNSRPRSAPDSVMAPSRRPDRRVGMYQKLGDLDRIVERFGANNAEFAGDRIECLGGAGERAGMRHRGGAAALRLAELDGDDRLSGGAREPAGRLELFQVGNGLDINDDDFQFRLVGKERDVIGKRKAGFVAVGDQVCGVHAALFERLIEEQHHAAALPDQRHRSGLQPQRPILGERDQTALGADVAHAVRAGDREPGVGDHRGELTAELGAFGVEAFAKTRREHRGAACARGRAAAQQFRHARRRHQHDEVIGRLRQRGEIRIAGLVPRFPCGAD